MSKDCTSEYNNRNTSKVQNEAWLKTLFDIVNDFYTQKKKGYYLLRQMHKCIELFRLVFFLFC